MLNQIDARPTAPPAALPLGRSRGQNVSFPLASTTPRAETRRRRERWLLVLGVLGVDTLALTLAVLAAGAVRVNVESVLPIASLGWAERHFLASVLVVPTLLTLFWAQGRYDVKNCLIGPREYAQIAHAITYGVLITIAVSYFAGGEPLVSRSWLLLIWLFSLLFVCTGRFLTRHAVRRLRRRGVLRTRVVIVGASSVGLALAEQFKASEGEGIDVVGFFDEYLPVGQPLLPALSVLGRPADLLRRDRTRGIDEFILVPEALPHERLEEITRLMIAREGPLLRLAVNSSSLLTHGVMVTQRGSVPLVTLQRARINGLDILLKRSLDIIGSLMAILLLTPCALLVLARRLGQDRSPFLVSHEVQTVGGARTTLWLLNPSVTSSLTLRGLPAFVAVLTGHLSLVGPRPVFAQSTEQSQAFSLTAVKPGLCGPWRLSGRHASRDDQALQDLSYVRGYSIWEDLRILWVTARMLVSHRSRAGGLGRWQDGDAHNQ